jgi:coenzyme F420-dependent glucose-6-phosphate dehydrogenase
LRSAPGSSALLHGETVTHRGRVTVLDAKLYSRPATAEFVGGWADGLLTTSGEPDQIRKVVEAFRRGGGEGNRLVMQVGLSWAPTEEEAFGNPMSSAAPTCSAAR